MEQLRVSIDSTKASLKQAQDQYARQQQLYKQGLTPKETLENAENLVKMRQADGPAQERQIGTPRPRRTQGQASLQNAKRHPSKARLEPPHNRILTRRSTRGGATVGLRTQH